MKQILIIGIKGHLAQITAQQLLHQFPHIHILGIDERDLSGVEQRNRLQLKRLRYSRSQLENLFNEHAFHAVYHLGRMSHMLQNRLQKRLKNNILGTQIMLDLALKHQVKKVIILSTFHVYGAMAENPVFLQEEAPLQASLKHPELRDVVEMDRLCSSWMWQHRERVETVLLRPCNIIGPGLHNAMTRYLRSPYSPLPIDFDPQFQFINEFDMAQVLTRALEELPTQIYNVCIDDYIDLRQAKAITDAPGIPTPIFLLKWFSKALSPIGFTLPQYLLDYLQFSCLIDQTRLKSHLGDHFWRFSLQESLKMLGPAG